MKTITLTQPIALGNDQLLSTFHLRKPMAGELRGIKLLDIMQMETTAHALLIPRISEPMVHQSTFYQLEPQDLMQVMMAVIDFFVSTPDSPMT